jgi:hypothetical protein
VVKTGDAEVGIAGGGRAEMSWSETGSSAPSPKSVTNTKIYSKEDKSCDLGTV